MTKMVALSDILNKKQISNLTTLINTLKKEKIDLMSPEYSRRIKEFLGEFKEELLLKGVDSDYLSYCIIYNLSRIGEHRG